MTGVPPPPSFSQHTIDYDFNGAVAIYATDVDGDGDTDVLGAAVWDDDLTWWENLQDFSISSAPPTQAVVAAHSASYALSLLGVNGFAREVSLSVTGLPVGTSAVFDPGADVPPFTSVMTVTTEAMTPVGSHQLNVIGPAGVLSDSVSVGLDVTNFAISCAPPSQILVPSSAVHYTVTVTSLNGFDQAVTLAVDGLPPGCSASFSPNPVLPTTECTMTVHGGSKPLGSSHQLEVVGTAGELAHSATVGLAPPHRCLLPLSLKNYGP